MKITDVKTYSISIPIPKPYFHPAWIPGFTEKHFTFTLIEILSDEGIKGYSSVLSFSILRTKKFIDKKVKPLIPEQVEDIADIERFVQNMRSMNIPKKSAGTTPYKKRLLFPHITKGLYMLRHFEPRLWCVEVALWDLLGKAKNKPVCELLGRTQERVKAYISTGEKISIEKHVEDARRYKEQGIKAIKLRAHHRNIKNDLKAIEKVRETVGADMEIMVDANQAPNPLPPFWSRKKALNFARELERLKCLWLEEPLPMHDLYGIRELQEKAEILIAGGELEQGEERFGQLLDCYDIIQPDVHFSGGIGQVKRIGEMAAQKGKMLIPHCWGSGLSLAANLQLIGSLSNCPYLEYPCDPPFTTDIRDAILTESIKIGNDGYVTIPQKPGLGVEVNEAVIKRYGKDS
ncbi:MAG TPA: mandelate racemase/muconate lactonizing enzyme family protein [Dehalococcoidia bacterium]|nr:mandelate racemase/muconate lactonizing enzyme family protein [Dehalococcoidia bacterium]